MIVFDLPSPLSVNRTRRIDWKNYRRVKEWQAQADAAFLSQKRKLPPPILGQYEIIITLRDGSRIDADNTVKLLCDAARRYQLVSDDSPKFMRRVTIEFGDVEGCRVTIKPL
jgi:Holliday junction resolvase RusA-like endonuclease